MTRVDKQRDLFMQFIFDAREHWENGESALPWFNNKISIEDDEYLFICTLKDFCRKIEQ